MTKFNVLFERCVSVCDVLISSLTFPKKILNYWYQIIILLQYVVVSL